MRRDVSSGEDVLDIKVERSVQNAQLAELSDSLCNLAGLRSMSYRGPGAPLKPTD